MAIVSSSRLHAAERISLPVPAPGASQASRARHAAHMMERAPRVSGSGALLVNSP
ncbi:MAG: hypothetical protein WBD82_05205 [Acidimicrobiales bacterium]